MDAFTKQKLILYFSILLVSLLMVQCALQLPPGGGEIDTIPPEIVKLYPADGTTNFQSNYFELTFSEYVDKRSLLDAIFISPAFEKPVELDWSWSSISVRVYFPEPLRENITYTVSIGTDLVDLNNRNRMAESFSFTFATGDIIDVGIIEGKVYNDKPSGTMIFAYKKPDTLEINPTEMKPDYISQAGDNGLYRLSGLAFGTYRIFAVMDEFRDLLYNVEADAYGAPYSDIVINDLDTIYSGLNFFLTKEDTSKPRLFSAVMTDRHHLLINFSEEIDSSSKMIHNFFLFDSTVNKSIDPVYLYKGNTKQTEMVLVTDYEFQADNRIFLFAENINDLQGNTSHIDHVEVITSDRPDTVKPGLFKTVPQARSTTIDFIKPKFFFYFDDAFDTLYAKEGIYAADTAGKKLPVDIQFIDDASFSVRILQTIKAKEPYYIGIDMNKIVDVAGNKLDTLYKHNFTTMAGIEFTGVSGSILNIDLNKNPLLILQDVTVKENVFQKPVTSSKFSFDRIDAGKYLLWGFYDTDSSGTYSYGLPYPFEPSEQFFFLPDTITLRPRWSITDIKFDIGKK